MKYKVECSQAANEYLGRPFNIATQRELDSESGDMEIPDRAVQAIKNGVAFLRSSLFACRKVGNSPFIRELVIPFGSTGYVAMFEIVDGNTVIIGAIRHQREDDYH
jgi:plasmid stabilization system protein ParE